MNRSDELFDLGSYVSSSQNFDSLADNIFNSDSDPNSLGTHDTPGEFDTMARFETTDTSTIAATASQAASMLPTAGSQHFVHAFDRYMGTDESDQASQPDYSELQPLEPRSPRDHNVDVNLVFDSGPLADPNLSAPTYIPAAISDEAFMDRQATPGPPAASGTDLALTIDQQRQWQEFLGQHTQTLQPQPQQLQEVEDQSDVALQASIQSPMEEQRSQDLQSSLQLESTRPPQTRNKMQTQDILLAEQIQLLQNAETAKNGQPRKHKHSRDASRDASREASHRPDSPSTSSMSPSSDDDEPLRRIRRAPKKAFERDTRSDRSNLWTSPTAPETEHRASRRIMISGLTFTSLRDAEEAMVSRKIVSDWRPPFPDSTVPTTQLQRSEYVVMMFEAFQDTSECKDNQNGFSFLKRWKHADYYDLQEMEKVCWHMLDIAERLHAHGPAASNVYCMDALKKLKASRGLTFEQRIHAICAMLRYSKNLCDNLMKGEDIEALVNAPKQKMMGAKTMVVQNQRRQKWILHGRNEGSLRSNLEANEDPVSNEDEATEPVMRKDKQKSERSRPAAKPRTKMNARSPRSPIEVSDVEEELDRLERRQSALSLHPRSVYGPTEADESQADAPEDPNTSTPCLRSQTEAHVARKVQTRAKAETFGRSRKRAIDQMRSEPEAEQSRPSKKHRGDASLQKSIRSQTRKTRATARLASDDEASSEISESVAASNEGEDTRAGQSASLPPTPFLSSARQEEAADKLTKTSARVTRSAKSAMQQLAQPKPNKLKRRAREDPDSEDRPIPAKRAKKLQGGKTRKSARVAAK